MLGERLADAALACGRPIAARQIEGLARYARLLLEWGRRINLTGARSLEALADLHLADAVVLSGWLPEAGRAVDVGSGGGLPALPLALLAPEIRWTLLEPVAKKVAFLRAAVREVGLGDRVTCLRQRDDEHGLQPGFQPYDLALARAVFPLPEWLARGRRLVAPGGALLGLGAGALPALPEAAEVRPYRLGDRSRAVIRLRV